MTKQLLAPSQLSLQAQRPQAKLLAPKHLRAPTPAPKIRIILKVLRPNRSNSQKVRLPLAQPRQPNLRPLQPRCKKEELQLRPPKPPRKRQLLPLVRQSWATSRRNSWKKWEQKLSNLNRIVKPRNAPWSRCSHLSASKIRSPKQRPISRTRSSLRTKKIHYLRRRWSPFRSKSSANSSSKNSIPWNRSKNQMLSSTRRWKTKPLQFKKRSLIIRRQQAIWIRKFSIWQSRFSAQFPTRPTRLSAKYSS